MPARSYGRSLWLLPFLFFSISAYSQKTINDVQLETSKTDGVRKLKATKQTELSLNREESLNLILNFDEKCNNEFKHKRKWTDKQANCRFHNNNLIETVYYRDIKNKNAKFKDHFLLLRHGYNRGGFLYFEEITVESSEAEVHIRQRLLSDAEVKTFIDTPLETNFSFQKVDGHFHVKSIDANKTQIIYTYESATDHWLLNKEMMIDQIFSSTANGLNDLFKSFNPTPL